MSRKAGRRYGVLLSVAILAPASGRSQTPGPTMIAVQDLAWSADGRVVYFSAMRVKPDYSDYRPDK